ncbi:hypothetical protein SAMN04515667_1620 [Formosa sp. Hel1_31_208]|nr:hypothetical protein SAMN04515667_1620 [Formosa sp. Hel1_31_208]
MTYVIMLVLFMPFDMYKLAACEKMKNKFIEQRFKQLPK